MCIRVGENEMGTGVCSSLTLPDCRLEMIPLLARRESASVVLPVQTAQIPCVREWGLGLAITEVEPGGSVEETSIATPCASTHHGRRGRGYLWTTKMQDG